MFFINIKTDAVVSKLEMPFHIKDVCFIDKTTMLAAFATKSPSKVINSTYASGLLYLSFDLQNSSFSVLDRLFLRPCAFDALCFDKVKGRFYVTDQVGDRVIIVEIKKAKISVIGEYIGFDFPHGIDLIKNTLAITNYGDSSIIFIDTNSSAIKPSTGLISRIRPYTTREIMGKFRNKFHRLMKLKNTI